MSDYSLDELTKRWVAPQPWAREAPCRGMNTDLFFPKRGEERSPIADRVCATCPVRMDCLLWAIENNEQFGFWGGVSPRHRRVLRKGKRSAELAKRSWRIEFVYNEPVQVIDGETQRPHRIQPGRRLRVSQVREIRQLRKDGWMVSDIARFFEVSERSIRKVLNGETWSGVT